MAELVSGQQPAAGMPWSTPQQWVSMWERSSPERRLEIARQVLDQARQATDCLVLNHKGRLEDLEHQLDQQKASRPSARLHTFTPDEAERCTVCRRPFHGGAHRNLSDQELATSATALIEESQR